MNSYQNNILGGGSFSTVADQTNTGSSRESFHLINNDNKKVKNLRADPSSNLLAGGLGGLLSLTVGHPFDTVKVRLQTMKSIPCKFTGAPVYPYSGGLDCFRKCVQSGGLLSFYRGMGGLAVFSIPRFSIMFYSNSWGRILGGKLETYKSSSSPSSSSSSSLLSSTSSTSSSPPRTTRQKDFSTFQILCGGIFSQLIVCPLIVNPLERGKVLLQTSSQFKGQMDCFTYILRSEGWKGLTRGTSLTLARDIPSFCTYFLMYESLRSLVAPESNRIDLFTTAFIGGLAGMCGWAVALPMDNLKNRHQVSLGQNNIMSTIKEVFRKGGFRQLYRGGTVVMVRAFPANAATFVGYEYTLYLLNLLPSR